MATPLEDGQVRFDVVRREEGEHEATSTVVFTLEESPVTIARAFWRALRRPETCADVATNFGELPASGMALLGRRLEASKG